MRTRGKIIATTILALLLPASFAVSASATPPPALERGGYITDVNDVLTPAEESAINAHLQTVAQATGVELYVAFVDEFTDPAIDTDWVEQTALINGLSDDQYFIGVATEAGMFAINGTDAYLSGADQDRVTRAMRPHLSQGDWADAVIAAGDEIHYLLVDKPARTAQTWLIVGLVALGIALLVVIIFVVRRVRRRAAERAEREAELQDLGQQANIALVRTDDLVRTSEQELEFARAQFGDDSIGEFVDALAVARANLNEAFTLKQQLEDHIPDSEQEREDWNTRIIALCTTSTETLEERKADFDELRKLEQNAPAALQETKRMRHAAGAEIDRAEQILGSLTARFAASAVESVADNPAQARARMTLTDELIADAEEAIRAERTGDAAVAIRAAEAAVQQATQLEDAVEALANDLASADAQTATLVTEVQRSIAEAETLLPSDPAIEPVISNTRSQLVAAQALLGESGRDPVQALRMLDAADTEIDAAVQRIRDEQAKIAHARTMLDGALRRADTQISAADSFISHRRGAIGQHARTSLNEARSKRALAADLASTDPVTALTHARRADLLASEALRQGRYDVDRWYGGSDSSNDSLGAFLGGLFLGQASGGGHRGGWSSGGGSSWSSGSSRRSSSWSSSRSSSRGGSFRVGSFGGSRSSGGFRSSGGSRSSRSGGRF